MEKSFWQSIQKNNYEIPAGHLLGQLTEELFTYLASIDPELRDTIGLEIFYNWLSQRRYTSYELRGYILYLLSNLQVGLGKENDDSVFLRSFSVLWLALIVQYDNETQELEKADIRQILEPACRYLANEADLRGYVPIKGFAHAIAHTSDLFGMLAQNRYTDTDDYLFILDCVADKLENTKDWIFIYNEDGRLARTLLGILAQNALTINQIKGWITYLTKNWVGAWQTENNARVYANERNLLRALHWYLQMSQNEQIQDKKLIMSFIEETLEQAKPWEF